MAKSILEALNELVEKQGGTTEDNKLIVDAINDLVATSGGGSSNLVIETYDETTNTYILDKTWREITDMLANGLVAIRASVEEGQTQTYLVGGTIVYNGRYDVFTVAFWEDGIDSTYTYSCQSENDYPSSGK